MIFAVLDVSLAVNLCINCSFFTFIFAVYYILSYYSRTAFLYCLHKSLILTGLDHANQLLVFFHLNFLFDSTN